MSNEYNPHLLEWTDEKVSRFWNFRNTYEPFHGTWFTENKGKEVLHFANKHVPIKGKVLDYGTGKGFLLQHLATGYASTELYACDFTDEVARETDEKFRSQVNFKGCSHITDLPSTYEDNFFDFVFLIETIEHLTDNYLHATLKEIQRILKPGGHVIITTPNDEPIEKNVVHCADCGATFHHMQHVRSWNVKKLTTLTNEFAFKNVYCNGVNLKWDSRNRLVHLIGDKIKNLVSPGIPPNLFYIGKK